MGLRIFPAEKSSSTGMARYLAPSSGKASSIIENIRCTSDSQNLSSDFLLKTKSSFELGCAGLVDDAEVVDRMRVTLPPTYRPDFIRRRLLEDVRSSSVVVDERMIGIVTQLRQNAYIVVASDNMQCFSEAQPAVLSGELSIDELIVSSDVGALKAEDPHRFFAGSLERFCMN